MAKEEEQLNTEVTRQDIIGAGGLAVLYIKDEVERSEQVEVVDVIVTREDLSDPTSP